MRIVKLIFSVIAAIVIIIPVGLSGVGTFSKTTKKKQAKETITKHASLSARFPLNWGSPVSLPSVDASVSTTISSTSTVPPTTTTHTHALPEHTNTVHSITENNHNDVWSALAMCESRMNQRATSKTGTYRGFFQFSMATWQSIGGPGDPRDHNYETQLHYAKLLQARSGWGQWPHCSRKLGLR